MARKKKVDEQEDAVEVGPLEDSSGIVAGPEPMLEKPFSSPEPEVFKPEESEPEVGAAHHHHKPLSWAKRRRRIIDMGG